MVDDLLPSTFRGVPCLRNAPEPLLYLYHHSSDEDVDDNYTPSSKLSGKISTILSFVKRLLWHSYLVLLHSFTVLQRTYAFLLYSQISVYDQSTATTQIGRKSLSLMILVLYLVLMVTFFTCPDTTHPRHHWEQNASGTSSSFLRNRENVPWYCGFLTSPGLVSISLFVSCMLTWKWGDF